MKEPKILRLVNDSIRSTSLFIDGKVYNFNDRIREVVVSPETDVESYTRTRNFVCGELSDAELLRWYKTLDFKKEETIKEVEITEEIAVEFLKSKNYVAYKKK